LLLFLCYFLLLFLSPSHAAGDSIRITEYPVQGTDFSGKEYTLFLDAPLSPDSFFLVRGSTPGKKKSDPKNDYIRITALPLGANGELSDSGKENAVLFSRLSSHEHWEGVVTVVECLSQCDTSGFRLRNVLSTTTNGKEESGAFFSLHGWKNAKQVVPFGGIFGSGSNVLYYGQNTQYRYPSAWIRLFPIKNNLIMWKRMHGERAHLSTAKHTIHIVEWGNEWDVQRRLVNGSSGGTNVDIPAEYDHRSISPVQRKNTWIWGTGVSTGDTTGNGTEGILFTLGNGASKNDTEIKIAVGSEENQKKYFAVYVMTHEKLRVQHIFTSYKNKKDLFVDIPISPPATSNVMSWSSNSSQGTGYSFPRAIFSARYKENNTIQLKRQQSGQNFSAWTQTIDFSHFSEQSTRKISSRSLSTKKSSSSSLQKKKKKHLPKNNPNNVSVTFIDPYGSQIYAPYIPMDSTQAQVYSQTVSGTMGDGMSRIRIYSPKGNSPWSLSLSPLKGEKALWEGDSGTYDTNDPSPRGKDGPDQDSVGGQMSFDFSNASALPSIGCKSSDISLGEDTAFIENVSHSVELAFSNTVSKEKDCFWDIFGIQLQQTVPPQQPPGNYSLDIVLTITAF
jgi:hypothetical protein